MNPEDREFECRLERLFEEAREPLPVEAFRAEIERRLHILRRRSLVGRVIVGVLLAGALAAATPLIVQGTLRVCGYVNESVPDVGGALLAPGGWMTSVLLAFLAMRRWLFGR